MSYSENSLFIMMKIIAHRGKWSRTNEKNSRESFVRAFTDGYGIETDIRDCNGSIVISHDPPLTDDTNLLTFDDFLCTYNDLNSTSMLALNIKSDGISEKVKFYLEKHKIVNYFTFDMSVPDFLAYKKNNLDVFCRASEFEDPKLLQGLTNGLWLDSFSTSYYEDMDLSLFLTEWSKIAIVSPELHGFDKDIFWSKLRKLVTSVNNKFIYLCTDFPDLAKEYFNE